MNKTETYRQILSDLPDWEPYLLQESGLPGPRGNLELAQVVADLGSRELFEHFLTYTAELAPVNDPHEFLAFCGVVGLGRLLAEGDAKLLERLRPWASDPRWRLREGVAMALQRLGKADMPRLLKAMRVWSGGTWLEKRAAAAALAEPALLHRKEDALAGFGDPGQYHCLDGEFSRGREGGLQGAATGAGLLLERGDGGRAGGRQTKDGEMAGVCRPLHPARDEGKPEKEPPDPAGPGLGGTVAGAKIARFSR